MKMTETDSSPRYEDVQLPFTQFDVDPSVHPDIGVNSCVPIVSEIGCWVLEGISVQQVFDETRLRNCFVAAGKLVLWNSLGASIRNNFCLFSNLALFKTF